MVLRDLGGAYVAHDGEPHTMKSEVKNARKMQHAPNYRPRAIYGRQAMTK
jgi:hypothetical protein